MPDAKRSQYVCNACMIRKKACDKVLPACGFCISRQLPCRYDGLVRRNEGRRIHYPGKNFILLHHQDVQFEQKPTQPSSFCVSPNSVSASLYQLFQHFRQLFKLTRDAVIDHYFKTFDKLLPIISANSFRQEASHNDEATIPPADLSVLLLAMLSAVIPNLDSQLLPPRASQDLLHASTKSALSQAQASVGTSLRLVQAALLISLREYTCVRPKAAYVSMMTCVGLVRILRIEMSSARDAEDTQSRSRFQVEMEEKENLAWSIAMLERLILCEMDTHDLLPHTSCSDLGNGSSLGSKSAETLDLSSKSKTPSSSTQSPSPASAKTQLLEWRVQSFHLLDRLLSVSRLTTVQNEAKLSLLEELNNDIRSFLEVAMSQLEWKQTRNCIYVAICVRLLFLVHKLILESLQNPLSGADHQKQAASYMTLDMVCRMILDIADYHGQEKLQIMPICCVYNMKEAMEYMRERGCTSDTSLSRGIDVLLRAQEQYYEAWAL